MEEIAPKSLQEQYLTEDLRYGCTANDICFKRFASKLRLSPGFMTYLRSNSIMSIKEAFKPVRKIMASAGRKFDDNITPEMRTLQAARILFNRQTERAKNLRGVKGRRILRHIAKKRSELEKEKEDAMPISEKPFFSSFGLYNKSIRDHLGHGELVCQGGCTGSPGFHSTLPFLKHMSTFHRLGIIYGCFKCGICYVEKSALSQHTCLTKPPHSSENEQDSVEEFSYCYSILVCTCCGISLPVSPALIGEDAANQWATILELFTKHNCRDLRVLHVATTSAISMDLQSLTIEIPHPILKDGNENGGIRCPIDDCGIEKITSTRFHFLTNHLLPTESMVILCNFLKSRWKDQLCLRPNLVDFEYDGTFAGDDMVEMNMELTSLLEKTEAFEGTSLDAIPAATEVLHKNAIPITIPFRIGTVNGSLAETNILERCYMCRMCGSVCQGVNSFESHVWDKHMVASTGEQLLFDSEYVVEICPPGWNRMTNCPLFCPVDGCKVFCCSVNGLRAHLLVDHDRIVAVNHSTNAGERVFNVNVDNVNAINLTCGLAEDGLPTGVLSEEERVQLENRNKRPHNGIGDGENPKKKKKNSPSSSQTSSRENSAGLVDDSRNAESSVLRPRSTNQEVELITPDEMPRLVCDFCGLRFDSISELLNHSEYHIEYKACHICKANQPKTPWKDILAMRDHLLKAHTQQKIVDGKVACSYCAKRFLPEHVPYHLLYLCKKAPCVGCRDTFKCERHKPRFECLCGQRFPHYKLYLDHTCDKTVRHGYRCNVCRMLFMSPSYNVQMVSEHFLHQHIGMGSTRCVCDHKINTSDSDGINAAISHGLHHLTPYKGSPEKALLLKMNPELLLGVRCDEPGDVALKQAIQMVQHSSTAKNEQSLNNGSAQNNIATIAEAEDIEVVEAQHALSSEVAAPIATTSINDLNEFQEFFVEMQQDLAKSSQAEAAVDPEIQSCSPANDTENVIVSSSLTESETTAPSNNSRDLESDAIVILDDSPPATQVRQEEGFAAVDLTNECYIDDDGEDAEVILQDIAKAKQSAESTSRDDNTEARNVVWVASEGDNEILVCDNVSPSKSTAQREKRYPCPSCTSAFYTKASLDNHVSFSHKNDISLLEKLCAEDFGIPLNSDLWICRICLVAFPDRIRADSHHAQHVRQRNPKLSCDSCSGLQLTPSNLKDHINQHTHIRYRCVKCLPNIIASSESGLFYHLREKHQVPIIMFCKLCPGPEYSTTNEKRFFEHLTVCTSLKSLEFSPKNVGLLVASDVYFQPSDVTYHKKLLLSHPERFVRPTQCSDRSLVRFGHNFATCFQDPACFGIVNQARWENVLLEKNCNGDYMRNDVSKVYPPSEQHPANLTLHADLGNRYVTFVKASILEATAVASSSASETRRITSSAPVVRPDSLAVVRMVNCFICCRVDRAQMMLSEPATVELVASICSSCTRERALRDIETSIRKMFTERARNCKTKGTIYYCSEHLPERGTRIFSINADNIIQQVNIYLNQTTMVNHGSRMFSTAASNLDSQAAPRKLSPCILCDQMHIERTMVFIPSTEKKLLRKRLPVNISVSLETRISECTGMMAFCVRHFNPHSIRLGPTSLSGLTISDVYFPSYGDHLAPLVPNLRTPLQNLANVCMSGAFNLFEFEQYLNYAIQMNVCDYLGCQTQLSSEGIVEQHLLHISNKSWKCAVCACVSCLDEKQAIYHIYAAHNQFSINWLRVVHQLRCPITSCGTGNDSPVFNSVVALRRHMNTVHKDALPFSSVYCATHFANEDRLSIHDLGHETANRDCVCCCYLCGVIDPWKVATNPRQSGVSHSLYHEMIHGLQREWVCKFCLNSFPTDLQLVQHAARHIIAPPGRRNSYYCPHCRCPCDLNHIRISHSMCIFKPNVNSRTLVIETPKEFAQSIGI